jgi:hypothetical protein
MGFLRKLFTRKSDTWRPLAEALGGRFVEGDSWKSARVEFEQPGYVALLTARHDMDTNYWATCVCAEMRTYGDAGVCLMKNWPMASLFEAMGVFDIIAAMAGMTKTPLADLQIDGDGFVLTNTVDEVRLFELDSLLAAIGQQDKLLLTLGEQRGFPFSNTTGQSKLVLLVPRIITEVDQFRSLLELHTVLVESAVAAGIVRDFGRSIE